MNRLPYTARALLLGLLTAQIFATIQVYLSNLDLYHTLVAINDAGYLAIPNLETMPNLRDFRTAFFGGFFFTLSVGAGLSIVAVAAAWVWDRLFSRHRILLIGFGILWIGCLLAVNRRGIEPLVTSYYLVLPPGVFYTTLRWMPPRSRGRDRLQRFVHAVPIVLLGLFWTSQMDSRTFLDLRDYLLLSNSLGKRMNAFYYDYTLYPAEVFKSLDQKMLKTCDLEDMHEKSMIDRMERELLKRDYLHTGKAAPVDLKISQEGNSLLFQNRGRTSLQTTLKDFFSNPGATLKEFSEKSDRHAFFRRFTYFSLLLGSPLALYIILYGLFRFMSSFFLDPKTSSVIASILCFSTGITLLIPFIYARGIAPEVKHALQALESEHWQERVAALRVVERKGIDIGSFHEYQRLMMSPHVSERYWVARALGVSRKPETYRDLVTLLDDHHPNVVSMAFYALGQRGDRRAVREILSRMKISTDWYNQWYAYKALRALGWKQTKSK